MGIYCAPDGLIESLVRFSSSPTTFLYGLCLINFCFNLNLFKIRKQFRRNQRKLKGGIGLNLVSGFSLYIYDHPKLALN